MLFVPLPIKMYQLELKSMRFNHHLQRLLNQHKYLIKSCIYLLLEYGINIWYIFLIMITDTFFQNSIIICIEKSIFFNLLITKKLKQCVSSALKYIYYSNWFKLVTSKLSYCKRWTKLLITSVLLILSTALNLKLIQGFRYLPYLGIPCWPHGLNLQIKIVFWFLY